MSHSEIATALRKIAAEGGSIGPETINLVANELDRQAACIARFVAITGAMNALGAALPPPPSTIAKQEAA